MSMRMPCVPEALEAIRMVLGEAGRSGRSRAAGGAWACRCSCAWSRPCGETPYYLGVAVGEGRQLESLGQTGDAADGGAR